MPSIVLWSIHSQFILDLLQGWSTLAAWGIEQLDMGEDGPVVELQEAGAGVGISFGMAVW